VSWSLKTAGLPWALSRLVVLGALALCHEVVSRTGVTAAVATRVHQGLLGWDAGWYESIAGHGYWGAGHQSLRFFPLLPLLARGLAVLPGVTVGAGLLIVANVSALLAAAALAVLARYETGDEALARRAAWFLCLAPPAFVLVMGYAEATLLALAVGTMLALRTRRWWWAALLGFLSGLTRPLGALLTVPAAIEAAHSFREVRRRERVGRVAAALAPAAGTGLFLGWVGWRYGDALAPLRIQEEGGHRGGLSDPVSTLLRDARYLVHGQHLSEALHLPWVLLVLGLLVVSVRWWPAPYWALAGAALVVALTAANLDSFERYALSTFPLVLAAATVTGRPPVERTVLVALGAGLFGYAVLAFLNLLVP
jgi:hypothetical protein